MTTPEKNGLTAIVGLLNLQPKFPNKPFTKTLKEKSMSRFIQLHILTSYPPSNLNRDDTAANIQRLVDNMERVRWLPKPSR